MKNNLFKYIKNKKNKNQFITATVSALTPLSIKIYPSDNAILCKSTTHLTGLAVNSNVIAMKIGSQFIIIAVIGAVP
jgi:hypothetical protein